MGRNLQPKHKASRRFGENVADTVKSPLAKKNYPPGMHGPKKTFAKASEYGRQLMEKQKAKIIYGLLEKQLKNLVKAVQTKKGETGEMILSLLETRLDNMVYRLGFAKTRMNARQFVSHGHILVNGKKVTIPSFQVKIDSEITIAEKIKQNPQFLSAMEEKEGNVLPFLKKNKLSGKLVRMPKKDDLEIPFDMQLIIEYYSR